MFDWEAYLDLAEALALQTGNEAAQRSAISRAYYAVFHAARDELDRRQPAVVRGGQAHAEIQQRLGQIDRLLGQDIGRLHGWRKNADYDDRCPFLVTTQATSAVNLARQVTRRIKALE